MFRVMMNEDESGNKEWEEMEEGEEVWDWLEDCGEDDDCEGVGENVVEMLVDGEWKRVDFERGRWFVK